MRFMVTFRIPTEKGNALAKDGSLGETIQSILEEIQPEAAYFVDMDGARGDTWSLIWTTLPRSPL
jgi:hypothetical protein